MLSEIRPKAYPRYLSLPILGSVLEEFIEWFDQQGYTLQTIEIYLNRALHIDRFFQQRGVACLNALSHDDFDKARQHYTHWNQQAAGTVRHIERFLREKGPGPGARGARRPRLSEGIDDACSTITSARTTPGAARS